MGTILAELVGFSVVLRRYHRRPYDDKDLLVVIIHYLRSPYIVCLSILHDRYLYLCRPVDEVFRVGIAETLASQPLGCPDKVERAVRALGDGGVAEDTAVRRERRDAGLMRESVDIPPLVAYRGLHPHPRNSVPVERVITVEISQTVNRRLVERREYIRVLPHRDYAGGKTEERQ